MSGTAVGVLLYWFAKTEVVGVKAEGTAGGWWWKWGWCLAVVERAGILHGRSISAETGESGGTEARTSIARSGGERKWEDGSVGGGRETTAEAGGGLGGEDERPGSGDMDG